METDALISWVEYAFVFAFVISRTSHACAISRISLDARTGSFCESFARDFVLKEIHISAYFVAINETAHLQ